MYTIFKQNGGSECPYLYKDLAANPHIVEEDGFPGVYRDKMSPTLAPLYKVRSGFMSVEAVKEAIGYLIKIDNLCGVDGYKAVAHRPALRIA
jgi:hypothetical protein